MEVAVSPAPKLNRVTVGDHWIDLRRVEDLTWDDAEVWSAAVDDAVAEARKKAFDPDTGARLMKVSADGVSQEPAPIVPEITRTTLMRRRDDLLGVLITAWSFDDLPLPYVPEQKKRLPLPVGPALIAALEPYIDQLQAPGPKETTEGSAG